MLTLRDAKLITPYRSPESKFIDRDMVDDEGYWTAYYVNPYVLGYNTKLVNKEDVPKTYEQLLDPKWKGKKISIDDSAYGFLAGLVRAWGKEKAVGFFKKFAAQEPVPERQHQPRATHDGGRISSDHRLRSDYPERNIQRTSDGWVPLEPVPVQVNPMMLASKAPHPNAGKLFIDFLLSKEGQKMLVGFRRISVREDVEPDPPRLFRGYKPIVEHPEDYKNFNNTIKLYQEIFGIR